MLLPKPLYIKLTDILHCVLSWGVKHVTMPQHVDRHAPLVLLNCAWSHAQGFFQGGAGGHLRSHTKDHSHWSGSKTSAHEKSRVEHGSGLFSISQLPRLMPQVGHCIQLVICSYAKKQSTLSLSNARVLMQLPEYGCQFSCEIRTRLAAQMEVPCRRVAGPSSDSSWQITIYIYFIYIMAWNHY